MSGVGELAASGHPPFPITFPDHNTENAKKLPDTILALKATRIQPFSRLFFIQIMVIDETVCLEHMYSVI